MSKEQSSGIIYFVRICFFLVTFNPVSASNMPGSWNIFRYPSCSAVVVQHTCITVNFTLIRLISQTVLDDPYGGASLHCDECLYFLSM